MKRLISLLLVFCLLLSMAANVVFATEAEPQAQATSEDVTVEGNNALGGMLAEVIREDQEEAAEDKESAGGYTVLGLTIEGNTATVSFDTMENAQVMVGLYSEDGVQLLASGKVPVTAEQHEVTVTIEGIGTLTTTFR